MIPKWFLAENVGGLSSVMKEKHSNNTKEMKEAGYVITAHKYKFEEYGILKRVTE